MMDFRPYTKVHFLSNQKETQSLNPNPQIKNKHKKKREQKIERKQKEEREREREREERQPLLVVVSSQISTINSGSNKSLDLGAGILPLE